MSVTVTVSFNVNVNQRNQWGWSFLRLVLQNITPTDIGCGQGLEIMLRDIIYWNKPSRKILVAPYRARNVHVQWYQFSHSRSVWTDPKNPILRIKNSGNLTDCVANDDSIPLMNLRYFCSLQQGLRLWYLRQCSVRRRPWSSHGTTRLWRHVRVQWRTSTCGLHHNFEGEWGVSLIIVNEQIVSTFETQCSIMWVVEKYIQSASLNSTSFN